MLYISVDTFLFAVWDFLLGSYFKSWRINAAVAATFTARHSFTAYQCSISQFVHTLINERQQRKKAFSMRERAVKRFASTTIYLYFGMEEQKEIHIRRVFLTRHLIWLMYAKRFFSPCRQCACVCARVSYDIVDSRISLYQSRKFS